MRKISPQMLRILIIKFAGTFGSAMLSFAIGLYILRRTGSALSMGVSLITGPLATVLLTPLVGYIVDTMKHKRIMVLAQIATSITLVAFALIFRVWPQH
jgi:MFS family permease